MSNKKIFAITIFDFGKISNLFGDFLKARVTKFANQNKSFVSLQFTKTRLTNAFISSVFCQKEHEILKKFPKVL